MPGDIKKTSLLWKDFSPPLWSAKELLLLGRGEMLLKIWAEKWGNGRGICSLREQSKQSRDAEISVLKTERAEEENQITQG